MTVSRLLPMIGRAPGIEKVQKELADVADAKAEDVPVLDPDSAAQRERDGQVMRERARKELAEAAKAIKRMEGK